MSLSQDSVQVRSGERARGQGRYAGTINLAVIAHAIIQTCIHCLSSLMVLASNKTLKYNFTPKTDE